MNTYRKFGDFSATQILREINFRGFSSKSAFFFAFLELLDLIFGTFQPSKITINSLKSKFRGSKKFREIKSDSVNPLARSKNFISRNFYKSKRNL